MFFAERLPVVVQQDLRQESSLPRRRQYHQCSSAKVRAQSKWLSKLKGWKLRNLDLDYSLLVRNIGSVYNDSVKPYKILTQEFKSSKSKPGGLTRAS